MSHLEALEQIRNFNLRFFRRQVEPKDDPPADGKTDGVVYGKVSRKFTRNRLFKNVIDEDIPTPEPGEIQRKLYGR